MRITMPCRSNPYRREQFTFTAEGVTCFLTNAQGEDLLPFPVTKMAHHARSPSVSDSVKHFSLDVGARRGRPT